MHKLKNITSILVLFFSSTFFSQNAYEVTKRLEILNIEELKQTITLLVDSEDYKDVLPKDEKEKLKTFKLFLDNPFSNSIDFKKLNVIINIVDSLQDKDEDGIPDDEDSCPNAVGLNTNQGCPDSDGDGIPDNKDMCPYTAGGQYGKGCLDTSIKAKEFDSKYHSVNSVLENSSSSKRASFTSFSGITPIVDGAAKFLVDRTKKEIALTFFENFTQKLKDSISFTIREKNNTSIPVSIKLSGLYPSTYTLLSSTEGLSLPSFGETWIVAFKKDLKSLPYNTIESLKGSKSFSNSEIGSFTLALASIIQGLNKGIHPNDIIAKLSLTNHNTSNKTNKAIKLVNLFTKNLTKTKNNKKQWLNTNDISSLSSQNKKYLFGWIYQESKSTQLIPVIHQLDNIDEFVSKYQYIIDYMIQIQKSIHTLETLVNKNEKVYRANFTELTSDVINLVSLATENVFSENIPTTLQRRTFISKIKPISRDIQNLILSVGEKSYGESLLNTISLLKDITNVEDDNPLIKNVSFYGNFLVDLVNASNEKNSDHIKFILDKYTLPISSYRIKRQKNFTIDIAAYPGINLGYEFSESKSASFGIAAPIGFSFSKKNNKEKVSSSSSSLFVSVVDIGAPFTYRLANDSAEGLPDNITWKQIFAPGLYYVYGINKSPFAISFGFQYAPLLRKIETNNVLKNENIFRTQLGITVDIPIFNLKK